MIKLLLSAITALMLTFSVGTSHNKPSGDVDVNAKENTSIQTSSDVGTGSSSSSVQSKDEDIESEDKKDDLDLPHLPNLPKITTDESSSLHLSDNITVGHHDD